MILSLLLLFFEAALTVFLVGISVHDIRQHIIKNHVLFWMLPFAAGRAVVNSIIAISGGAVWYHPILSHIGGAVFAFALFLIVAMIFGGIGGGDIKLAGACGLVLGFERTLAGLIIALCLLLLYHGIGQCIRKIGKEKCEAGKEQAYPLVPFLLLGMLLGIRI